MTRKLKPGEELQKWRETTEEIRIRNANDTNYDKTEFSLNKFIAKIGIFVIIGAFLLGLLT